MNNKIIKTLFITFIMFFSVFFINIDDAKAEDEGTKQTGIRCRYIHEDNGNESWEEDNQELAIRIIIDIFYGKKGSNDYYSMNVTCVKYHGVESSTDCVNTDKLKAASEYASSFVKNGRYTCPSTIYGYHGVTSKPFELSSALVTESIQARWNYKADYELFCNANENLDACKSQGDNEAFIKNAESKKQESEENTGSARISDQIKNNIEWITNWGNNNTEGNYSGYDADDVGERCGAISQDVKDMISTILWIIDIIGIILLLIMTALNFIKAITGSDEENLKKAFKNLVIRAVVVIILLLLPVIVGTIIDIINDSFGKGTVVIGEENGSPFCDIAK